MTPARSLAARVVALGIAGTVTAPGLPAYGAPAPCERAENYAGQSGAEVLRIEKLSVRAAPARRPAAENGRAPIKDAAGRVLGAPDDPTAVDPQDSDTISEGVSMLGDAVLDSLPVGSGAGGRGGSAAGPNTDGRGVSAAGPNTSGRGGSAAGPDTGRRGGGAARPDTGGRGGGAAMPEADRTATVSDVGVGEARTAMIANTRVKSAALARMLAGRADDKALTAPVFQQAPPTHDKAARRGTPAGTAGPVGVGAGQIGAHARWSPGMACGATVGEAARAETSQPSVALLRGSMVRMPAKVTSLSMTTLERRGTEARTVASATVTAGLIELAGGQVRVRVLRAPTLTAGMSTRGGGEVAYVPAVVEVSGKGIGRKRLQTAGDHVDVTVRPDRRALEDAVAALDGLRKAAPLPLPEVPGLPPVAEPRIAELPAVEPRDAGSNDAGSNDAEPQTESTPGAGTRVRISLGDVRQARKGQAIAARATAIKVTITRSEARSDGDGRGTKAGYGVTSSLALGVGVLEAAAVAPDAVAVRGPAHAEVSSAGSGGGLPITGPQVHVLALGGAALLAAGIAAVLFATRRRRS